MQVVIVLLCTFVAASSDLSGNNIQMKSLSSTLVGVRTHGL